MKGSAAFLDGYSLDLRNLAGPPVPGNVPLVFQVNLSDGSATAFGKDALPSVVPLSSFTTATWTLSFADAAGVLVTAIPRACAAPRST